MSEKTTKPTETAETAETIEQIIKVSNVGEEGIQVEINGTIEDVESALIGLLTDVAGGLTEQANETFALVYLQEIMVQVSRSVLDKKAKAEMEAQAQGEGYTEATEGGQDA